MKEKRYNFTYRTISDSGKYYIGRHSTDNIDDGYQGSGKWVKMCKKSGKDLITEPLNFYNTYDELLIAEQILLDEHIDNPLCMNFNNRSSGFAVGDKNPARSEKERKRRSEESWTKTDIGRQWISDNNPSKRDDVKVKRSIQLKEQWKDPEYRDSRTGDNHHMRTKEHKDRMKNDNPMFKENARKKSSEKCRDQLNKGTHNFQNPDIRAKAAYSNSLRKGQKSNLSAESREIIRESVISSNYRRSNRPIINEIKGMLLSLNMKQPKGGLHTRSDSFLLTLKETLEHILMG